MGISQAEIASGPVAARRARKIQELSETHGSIVGELVECGRLPAKAIDNLYGRHAERREAILAAMRQGVAYSAAYKQSSGCFDTTRWPKIAIRAAACRGYLLKTLSAIDARRHPIGWKREEVERIEAQARSLAGEAVRLVHAVARCEMAARPERQKQRKRTKSGCLSVAGCTTDYKRASSELSTATTKLKKNVRDVPQMIEKTGSAPTVADVARTAVEAARIINNAPLLIEALKAKEKLPRGMHGCSDLSRVGRKRAERLDAVLPGSRPLARLATHRAPDADALVSTWIADRFLFADEECKVEFVSRQFVPGADSPFRAVLDVGRRHDLKRLIFDHKPPAFSHRDQECATSLVWQHAMSSGWRVGHLQALVELVHDGDSISRRHTSAAYKSSRSSGLHALIACARQYATSDQMLYQGVAGYLDAKHLRPE